MRPTASGVRVNQDSGREQVLSAQLRLLYANTTLGVGVNILAATILAGLQWGMVQRSVVIGWWLYMTLVSVVRYAFARRYWHASPTRRDIGKWRTAITVGVAFDWRRLGRGGNSAVPAGSPDKPGFSRLRVWGE